MPVDAVGGQVSALLPGSHVALQVALVLHAVLEALAGEHAEFDLGHVEPASVARRVVPLDALDQAACFLGDKGLVQAMRAMGVEVVLLT